MSREMKESGILNIGQIPITWDVPKIGYYFRFHSGDTLTNQDIDEFEGSYTVYGANGQRGFYNKYNTVGKHILLGRVGALCGNVHIISGKNWVTEHALILDAKKTCVEEYCGYLFETMSLGQYSKASAQPVISVDTISNLRFILPSPAEQRLIADFLDKKCSLIDEISKKIQEEINTLEEYKKSVITEAVTKGLDPNVEMKDSGIEWIGNVPAKWDLNRVANLFAERNEPGEESLPFLSVSINSGISDRELAEEETSRQFIRADAKKNKKVYPGDIVYNMMRAWQGAIGAVRTTGMVSAAYATAKPLKNIDTRYFEYLLRTPTAIQEMNKYSYGIMDFRKRLYWSYFRNITLCVPPIEEQKDIADYADAVSREIEELVRTKNQQLSTLEENKKSLIYEYVTGKKEVKAIV